MPDADDPITLPTIAPPPQRPPIPILAAVVPIAGAGVLWLVTGSALTLLFAAIGPLVAVASLIDGHRSGRRNRRRAARELERDRQRAAGRISARHDAERAALRRRHPDVGALLAREDDVWRRVRERDDHLLVGYGDAASSVRVAGGEEGDPLRAAARTIAGAPITVALRDGVCVIGPPVLASAVARALVLQLCLVHSPRELGIVGVPAADRVWADVLPHRRADAPLTVALAGAGDPDREADVVVAAVPTGAPAPVGCAAVIDVRAPADASLVWGSATVPLAVEAIARPQAESIAHRLARRAQALAPASAPAAAGLSPLLATERADTDDRGLAVAFARGADGEATVDLVADGPHAIVTGVTGTGKSELLTSWIVALAARYSTRQLSFLLADFKGGTAFDPLRDLPHVTGVVTDLDAGGAGRAIESLRAELRRREERLAAAGARDAADREVHLSRLVIVVDEFAALLADHPELHRVFVDIGARGRALGMHLVLGTQRATGVIRDGLLANCPLRLSLRSADTADSMLMIGTDAAAQLAGGRAGLGRAQLRRAGDTLPHSVTVAVSRASDIESVQQAAAGDPAPHRPWQPPLPDVLTLADLASRGDRASGELMIGLRDDPAGQRQQVQTIAPGRDRGVLVVGGPQSGRSNLVALLAAQHPAATLIPADPEQAWDVVHTHVPTPGGLLLCDDVDALLGTYPPEYASAFVVRLEQLVRASGPAGATTVLTTQRLPAAIARVGDLLPQRLVLRLPDRVDHIAAGADADRHDPDAPPGRGCWGRWAIQVARAPRGVSRSHDAVPLFDPRPRLTGLVTRRPSGLREAFAASMRVVVLAAEKGLEVTEQDAAVLIGDPDQWQRAWTLLAQVRERGDLIVAADCAAEFRLMTGSRDLPPYVRPGANRGWWQRPDGSVTRVELPASAG